MQPRISLPVWRYTRPHVKPLSRERTSAIRHLDLPGIFRLIRACVFQEKRRLFLLLPGGRAGVRESHGTGFKISERSSVMVATVCDRRILSDPFKWAPRSRSAATLLCKNLICFGLLIAALSCHAAETVGVFNVLGYGAKGDGTNDDTAAVQKAIDTCAAQGGGEVLLPAGTFLTGALTLHSGIDFHLA